MLSLHHVYGVEYKGSSATVLIRILVSSSLTYAPKFERPGIGGKSSVSLLFGPAWLYVAH